MNKLFASLDGYLPAGAKENQAVVEVPANASPADVLRQLRVPPGTAHLVLLNGVFVPEERRSTSSLSDGDVLAIWPPVAGG